MCVLIVFTICCLSGIYASGDIESVHDYNKNEIYNEEKGIAKTFDNRNTPSPRTVMDSETQTTHRNISLQIQLNNTTDLKSDLVLNEPKVSRPLWMWVKKKGFTGLEIFGILSIVMITLFTLLLCIALIYKLISHYCSSGWRYSIPTTSL